MFPPIKFFKRFYETHRHREIEISHCGTLRVDANQLVTKPEVQAQVSALHRLIVRGVVRTTSKIYDV